MEKYEIICPVCDNKLDIKTNFDDNKTVFNCTCSECNSLLYVNNFYKKITGFKKDEKYTSNKDV